MIGIILLLAALGVAGLLAAVLLVVIRARLRERNELARLNQPSQPDPEAIKAVAAPRKPPLTPWLVISGILVVVLTLVSGMVLRSCQAFSEDRVHERQLLECRSSLEGLAQWFYSDWDQRKALAPAEAVPVASYVRCPLGNHFKYLGGREILLAGQRVLVVETGEHQGRGRGPERHAILADPKFLNSGKTGAEYQSAANSGNAGYVYHGMFFKVDKLSEVQYETISQAVAEAP